MTDKHPIIPSPELVQQWVDDFAPLGMLPLVIQAARWGTFQSYDKDGQKLITSMTEDLCVEATRWYLQERQRGFTKTETSYDGTVSGKL